MRPIGTLSTVNPNERVPRPGRELAKCAACGWRQRRSPRSRYCTPCKDEIDNAVEEKAFARLKVFTRLNGGRYSATKKGQLPGVQRPW